MVKQKFRNDNQKHLDTLMKQGEFINFCQQEKQDPIWKSFIWNLKFGTAKFLLNSLIHTLPTQNNLKLWNKSVSDKCFLCGNRDSTKHTLSSCKVSLDQGRLLWRHNNIIKYIVDCIDTNKYKLHSDIDGLTTSNGGTIPANVTVTGLKPDITVLDENQKKFHILELSVPFEGCIADRHTDKHEKYSHFLSDISQYNTVLTCFEVGVRGFLTKDNITRLQFIYTLCKKNIKKKTFFDNISALSIMGSYYIFTARKNLTWGDTGYLHAPF